MRPQCEAVHSRLCKKMKEIEGMQEMGSHLIFICRGRGWLYLSAYIGLWDHGMTTNGDIIGSFNKLPNPKLYTCEWSDDKLYHMCFIYVVKALLVSF